MKSCRFCESEDETIENNVKDYISDIKLITQVDINLHPNLPLKICNFCITRLKEAISFRTLCRRSEESLLSNYLVQEDNSLNIVAQTEEIVENTLNSTNIYTEIKVESIESDNFYEAAEESKNTPVIVSFEEILVDNTIKIENEQYVDVEILEDEFDTWKVSPKSHQKQNAKAKLKVKTEKPSSRTMINDTLNKLNIPIEGPYHCLPCNKTYLIKTSFFSHYRDHHDETPRRFVCHLCGITYKRRVTLVDHLNVHKNLKPFKCDMCSSSFARKYALMKHMQCHAVDKRFKCKYCQKGFSYWIDQRRHETIHSGIFIYNCSLCSKGFNRKKQLIAHEAKHTETMIQVSEVDENYEV